jgi:subtilase family serine protease
VLALGVAALAATVHGAPVSSAVSFRPAVSPLPFVRISDAAARAAKQTPLCPPQNPTVVCYSPSHLRDAYDFPNQPTGRGQTIVVVSAYGSGAIGADITSDLAQFDAENGLPAPPSFTVVEQQSPAPVDGSGAVLDWAIETSLDVEYAHAMAPGADIVLAVAANDHPFNLFGILREVLPQYPGSIVTQSFGGDETGDPSDLAMFQAFDRLYAAHIATGGTVLASSGDLGATGTSFMFGPPAPTAAYPASSPLVLAVGGTEGNPYPDGLWRRGKYGGEQVWNEVLQNPDGSPKPGASGGAPSAIYDAPEWQRGMTGSDMRAEPDVSYDAANNGGVVIVMGGQHGVVGGTSAGTPQWAAIVALANELRVRQHNPQLGLVAPQLYELARDRKTYGQDFHDITTGTNALFGGAPPYNFPGFEAGPGYDYPTGLGTTVVSRLIKDLAGRGAKHLRLDDLAKQKGRGHGHGRFEIRP